MKRIRKIVEAWMMIGVLLSLSGLGVSAGDMDDPEDITEGVMIVPGRPGQSFVPLPIEHTAVRAEITGFMARVDVEQQFGNPFSDAIEAVYLFPLPQNAAVDAMTMTIGSRTIRGVIRERGEAERIYQRARDMGKTAALLTQERPNIFTQAVANILPGDRIVVRISYVQDLSYDDGTYTFNFPMVVGPRFIPGYPTGRTGGGFAPDTDRVPDGSRITPHVLPPDVRSGHTIDLEVFLDAGLPIRAIRSSSHAVSIDRRGRTSAAVTLDPMDSIPNRDFILQYDVAGEKPEAAILTHHGEEGGFFTLMIQPQDDFVADEVMPKELIFVVDCSGSMHGAPLNKAKAAMRQAIMGMNPDDSFQIIQFSQAASSFAPAPIPNTPQNVRRGLAYLESMNSEGGTQMIEGIRAALGFPRDPSRLRMVLFMTDGYIGNETQILAEIDRLLGNARLFSFGVGTSVNHYLLDSMATAGRGFVQYVRPDEDTTEAVQRIYDRINNPLLTDISIDWNRLDVRDMYPAVIPDLFSTQPVIIHGRFEQSGKADVTLRGFLGGAPWTLTLPVTFSDEPDDHDVLGTLWARARIESLMRLQHRTERPDVREDIIRTALRFRIMSQYTAFVAVSDAIRRDPEGRMETVEVPVELPEMVSRDGVFGGSNETVSKKTEIARGIGSSPGVPMVSAELDGRTGMAAPREQEKPQKGDTAPGVNEQKAKTKDADSLCLEIKTLDITIRSTSGTVDREAIMKELEGLRKELRGQLSQAGAGRILVQIETESGGSVKAPQILESNWQNPEIGTRLLKIIGKISLSKGPAMVVIEIRVR